MSRLFKRTQAGRRALAHPESKTPAFLSEDGRFVQTLKKVGSYFLARVARAGLRPPWPRPICLARSERALA